LLPGLLAIVTEHNIGFCDVEFVDQAKLDELSLDSLVF
jgi:hypothetical protein